MLSRRRLLGGMGLGAVTTVVPQFGWATVEDTPYKKSSYPVPSGACDCHVHVFDPSRFPYAPDRLYTPDDAPRSALESHLARLSIDRVVLVQPSPYSSDNRCLLDTLSTLGQQRARGVAVVRESFSEVELRQFHEAGVRGLRINLDTYGKADPAKVAPYVRSLAKSVSKLGWHLQMYTNLETVKALMPTLNDLPVPIVLDHCGHLNSEAGKDQPGYAEMLGLLASGKIYIKVSALYRVSKQPGYADAIPYLDDFISTRPDRLLWGSDWPHTMPAPGTKRSPDVIEKFRVEDDGFDLDQIMRTLRTPQMWQRVLVDNPARLYWS